MLNRIPIFGFLFSELKEGISLTDEDNNSLDCQSKTAAVQGISSVVLSRIGMACPGMGKFFFLSSTFCRFTYRLVLVLTPLAVQYLTNKGFFKRRPWANTPIQLGLVGAILIFATPLGCALFSQTASINVSLSITKISWLHYRNSCVQPFFV